MTKNEILDLIKKLLQKMLEDLLELISSTKELESKKKIGMENIGQSGAMQQKKL